MLIREYYNYYHYYDMTFNNKQINKQSNISG